MGGEIIGRLDAFIRKYYLNSLIRGILLGSGLITALLLLITAGEYFAYFPGWFRAFLFWSFSLSLLAVLWLWIIKPLAGMYRLGRVISYEQAAVIIGKHFAHVEDKLLNLLQLENMKSGQPESALMMASIEQKTRELRPIPFTGAVNLSSNRRYLRWVALPVLLFVSILLFQSHVFFDAGKRIIAYNQKFEPKAPFEFVLKNKSLRADRGSDYKILMRFAGKSIPEAANLIIGSQQIQMKKEADGSFSYEIENVQNSVPFHFNAAGFSSGAYMLNMLPAPAITDVEILAEYPYHVGRASEKLINATELNVPEGTVLRWRFKTRDAGMITAFNGNERIDLKTEPNTGFARLVKKVNSGLKLKFTVNEGIYSGKDTLVYHISTTLDQNPSIAVEKKDDSADLRQFWFTGSAGDDYGLSKILVRYRISASPDKLRLTQKWTATALNVVLSSDVDFVYGLNLDVLGLKAGEEIEYFFEAWDNDGVRGPKSSATPIQILRRQSVEEIRNESDMTASKIQQMMQDAMARSKQLQKEAEEMRTQMGSSKSMSWEDKQRVDEYVKKQEALKKEIEQLKKEQEKFNRQQTEIQPNPENQEKREQMEKLFQEMQNPEMQKLMEEIQKLLEKKAPKEQIAEKMEQLQKQNKEQAKDMKQLMEQFKQLQLEQKLADNLDRLNKLAQEQEKLAEKTAAEKKANSEQLKQTQEQLNKELDALKKEMQEAEKLNSEMEKPMDLELGNEEQNKAGEEQKQASENLEQGKNKKASENQKNAAEQLKKAAEKMQKSMEEEKKKRLEEDYKTVRELLENLVETSFEQEYVFTELNKVQEFNPRFVELNKKQMQVREKCAFLEDSLRALAKRQPMVSTYITREVAKINSNMDAALENLKVRKLSEAGMREQYVMTGLNNLAVMLLESMQKMQQKMSQDSKSKGSKSCNNPNKQGQGNGKPKKGGDKLSQGQEQLGKMLQEMQKKGQQGKQGKEGEPKPGGQGSQGDKEMNREYARMALMQEALRREIQKLRKELEQQGKMGAAKELQKTEQLMEQNEKELVNKKLDAELLRRQKEIETRMLEHEKAEHKQQQEEQRQASSAGEFLATPPAALQEYIKEKKREKEILKQAPVELTPYYKEKVKGYFQRLN
jgi:hypothetical protein